MLGSEPGHRQSTWAESRTWTHYRPNATSLRWSILKVPPRRVLLTGTSRVGAISFTAGCSLHDVRVPNLFTLYTTLLIALVIPAISAVVVGLSEMDDFIPTLLLFYAHTFTGGAIPLSQTSGLITVSRTLLSAAGLFWWVLLGISIDRWRQQRAARLPRLKTRPEDFTDIDRDGEGDGG